MKNLTASWPERDQESDAFFKNLNFEMKNGCFVGLIGPVGSGKSSFLSILMNEMAILNGKLESPQKIAYCPQDSWIFMGTIRDNILIGREFERKKYENVTRVCSLVTDFAGFPNRDQTIVGEKGVTLSGGQKARINLARALYRLYLYYNIIYMLI